MIVLLFRAGMILVLLSPAGWAQDRQAQELLKFLQTRDRGMLELGLFSCGAEEPDRRAAADLYRLGESAVASLEAAIRHSMATGNGSAGIYWIESVYAALRKERALPLLPPPGTKRTSESILAIAWDLTSYVSESRPPVREFSCTRRAEPRNALDRVILGWLKGDWRWLATGTDPDAEAGGPTDHRPGTRAVGYRFEGTHSWAVPVLPFGESSAPPAPFVDQAQFEIPTRFTDRLGRPCGEISVSFRRNPASSAELPYLVEADSVPLLLSTISACAAR